VAGLAWFCACLSTPSDCSSFALASVAGDRHIYAMHTREMLTRIGKAGPVVSGARDLTIVVGALVLFGATPANTREAWADSASVHTHAARCMPVFASIEQAWGSTNEWRRLAPIPVPREATPTRTTGVWLERWQLENGKSEIRRVSATETKVAAFDEARCLPIMTAFRRTFAKDSLHDAFTDASLDSLMHANTRGMIYVWSPRMPLSIKGLTEARAAADSLGIAFTALVAAPLEEDRTHVDASVVRAGDWRRMQSLELFYRNATVHYPAALYYQNGRVIDGVYAGYKNRETFARFGARQLSLREDSAVTLPPPPKFWLDRKARITNVSAVNTPRRIGFFFKPITGTSLVSYNAQGVDYFFDTKTSREMRVPGHVDPVPTPDGRFLTLPGLHLHPIPSLLAGDHEPVFTDPQLPDEYQTASILNDFGNITRYRVVTGWNAGARFRDYDVKLNGTAAPTIAPVAPPFVPCKDRFLTLPINAKSGSEFGALDAAAKSNMIFDVTSSTTCAVKLDLGFVSGKISFSYDGAFIAFATSRINTDATGELIRPSDMFYKDALVLERKTGRIINLSQNAAIEALTFPEFQKDGSVMLLDQYGPNRPVEQLRVVRFK
jgi:hypothetical protein